MKKLVLCVLGFASLLPLATRADQHLAGNVTVTGGASTGNLNVTGAIDSDSNAFTFGTQGTSFGGSLLYQDSNIDTFTFGINRTPASWLWQHNSAIKAMRLDSSHQLLLFNADGTTAGVTLTPASSQLSLGTATLTGSGTTLTAGAAMTITGTLTAQSSIINNGTITGGTTGLSLSAGGTNQNITLMPSGTGYTFVQGGARFTGGGTFGYTTNVGANNGLILGTVAKSTAPSGGQGSIQINSNDGTNPLQGFVALMTDTTAANRRLVVGAIEQGVAWRNVTLAEGGGNVGIGTSTPAYLLHVNGQGRANSWVVANPLYAGSLMLGSFADYLPTLSSDTNLVLQAGNGANLIQKVGGLEAMRITSTGNVGIGTTTPITSGGGGAPRTLEIEGAAGQTVPWGQLVLSSPNAGAANDILGGIEFASRGVSTIPRASYIYSFKEDGSTTSAKSNLQFGVNNGAFVSSAMTIRASGNVGIGTSDPQSSLHVSGGGIRIDVGGGVPLQNQDGAGNILWQVKRGTPANGNDMAMRAYGGFSFAPNNSDTSLVRIETNGNVGIGTTNPGTYKLAVKGTIHAQEIVVDNNNWADYVFDDSYRLAPLSEVEQHIKAEKHLPGIPSAQEIAEHGVSMGDMQSKLLSKVEELTLHLIRLEKENNELRQRVQKIEAVTHP